VIARFKPAIYLTTASLIGIKLGLSLVINIYPIADTGAVGAVNARELITITNQYRAEQGLDPLIPDARLTQAAIDKAQDIIRRDYFSHTDPAGHKFSYWIQKVNYDYFYAGENLALDFHANDPLFDAWIASPSHRDNIVSPYYQDIGIAVLTGRMSDRPTTIVVQMFGGKVMGANETREPADAMYDFSNYSTELNQSIWPSLATLDYLNLLIDYPLIISLILSLMSYRPLADHQPDQYRRAESDSIPNKNTE